MFLARTSTADFPRYTDSIMRSRPFIRITESAYNTSSPSLIGIFIVRRILPRTAPALPRFSAHPICPQVARDSSTRQIWQPSSPQSENNRRELPLLPALEKRKAIWPQSRFRWKLFQSFQRLRLSTSFSPSMSNALRHSPLNNSAFFVFGNPLAPSIRRVICAKLSFG